ncbi:class I SAM-dependent methyltransferase [Pseudarthrobacter sp. L19]|uniref:class I SAM-dependent methyltransferase n=1 Tax=Pseudarthrobacter sp. L19 TaxID=3423951 RepID=UPI003D798FAF
MSVSAESLRDQQRVIWDSFAAGWKKWDAEVLGWQGPFGDAVLEDARLGQDFAVLDVAAGTGGPGLTAASLVPRGTVALTDISAGMLHVAEEKAAAARLENVTFTACAAVDLPFPDASFDAVLCRFGFLYFPDLRGRWPGWCGRPGPVPASARRCGAGRRKTLGQPWSWGPSPSMLA